MQDSFQLSCKMEVVEARSTLDVELEQNAWHVLEPLPRTHRTCPRREVRPTIEQIQLILKGFVEVSELSILHCLSH